MTHFAGITKATMNPTHLSYHHLLLFWEVSRAGSLRAASVRLHLSQPTIKALEKSLEEQLFDRTGRGLKLTPGGRLVMECAAEIFSLGTEMVRSLPKLVAWRLIQPAVRAFPNLQLSCVKGHAQELLGSLAGGRLDVVLSDEAAPSSLPVKAFNHLLGESPVVFCATPLMAKNLGLGFPGSLKDA